MFDFIKGEANKAWVKIRQEITIIREIGWTTTDLRRLQHAASFAASLDAAGKTKFSIQQIMGATEFIQWGPEGEVLWPSLLSFAKRFAIAGGTVLLGLMTCLLMVMNLFQNPLSLGSHLILAVLGAICLWFGQNSFRRLIVAIQLHRGLNQPISEGEG